MISPRSLLCLFACSCLLFGCRKSEEKMAEKAVEKATGGQVEIDSKTGQVKMKQKGADGKETEVQLGQNSTLPADFPKNVPIYPGAKIMASVSISRGENGHMITLSTKDGVTAVLDFYKKNLPGFKVEGELSADDTTILTMSSDTQTVSVTASKSSGDDSTMIQLTTTKNTAH
jgi:hypothetical protein